MSKNSKIGKSGPSRFAFLQKTRSLKTLLLLGFSIFFHEIFRINAHIELLMTENMANKLRACPYLGIRFLAITRTPSGLGSPNPAKKLPHWVNHMGQPLSRNRVF